MGDFNINLLHAESSRYAQELLLSLQSFSFIPTTDKPKRVHNSSATLIHNILTNKVDANCQQAIRAKTLGWRGGSRIEPRKTRL